MEVKNNKKNLLIVFLILTFLIINGCSTISSLTDSEDEVVISNLSADALLTNSETIRKQTLDLIGSATQAIFIQQSILDDPDILNKLIEKSHNGIEVRILLDKWQRENQKSLDLLKNQNVSVHLYPSQKGQYDRVKYMVVDYKTAVYYSSAFTKNTMEKMTMAVKLTGDSAWTTAKLFNNDWEFTTTLALELPETLSLEEDNITIALNANVKQQIIKAINSASESIKIEVEQLSDPETVQAIINARARDCEVKLLESPDCKIATPDTIKKLIEGDIEIRYYKNPSKQPLNYNIGIFDNQTMIFSSSAWTYYTFVINHESSLTIPAPDVIKKLNAIFESDWQNSAAN